MASPSGAAPTRLKNTRVFGEVVLAAGAVGTPQILQLSGIGPAPLLAEHGIDLRHELPGVGENPQDHLQIRAVFAVEGVKTLNTITHSWLGKLGIGLRYLATQSGPMSMRPWSTRNCACAVSPACASPMGA